MRVLFWIFTFIFFLFGLLAAALLSAKSSDEGAGMAFIFFLPFCAINILAGIVTALIRWTRGKSLTRLERGVSWIIVGLLLVCVLVLATEFRS